MAVQLPLFYNNIAANPDVVLSKSQIKKVLMPALTGVLHETNISQLDICPIVFRDTYLHQMVFSKYTTKDPKTAAERRRTCLEKYLACESRCKETNRRFEKREFEGTKFHHLLMLTRKHLNNILGVLPDNWLIGASFGPGASTRLSRKYSDSAFKFEGIPHTTSLLLPLVKAARFGPWSDFEVREYAEFLTVPKNSSTDRPIEIQPDMNLYLQKSLGKLIRCRMRGQSTGAGYPALDLNDQNTNREFARLGSFSNPEICTLDLSSASDLLAARFVEYVVEDHRWLTALYLTRCGLVKIKECGILPLQKFSAMGNGYTWELQSAIFYCMIRACNEYSGNDGAVCSIFGDDIICHRDVSSLLIEFLEFCGLKVNTDKSFTSGFFRESCGKHYYKGFDVSPFYLRGPIEDTVQLYAFHNRLHEWMSRDGFKDVRFLGVIAWLREHTSYQFEVPPGYGDGGFRTCRSDVAKLHVVRNKKTHTNAYVFKSVRLSRSTLDWPRMGSVWKSISGYDAERCTASVLPFGTQRAAVRRSIFLDWSDLGSWF